MPETPPPGADELRVRQLLIARQVGPDAAPAAPVADDSDGWWHDLYPEANPTRRRAPRIPDWWRKQPTDPTEADGPGETAEPDTTPEPVPPAGRFTPQPGYWPRPHTPAVLTDTRDRTQAAISRRTRQLIYNASAAATGWVFGLYGRFAWALNDCGTTYSTGGALTLGIVASLVIAHVWDRRTRHWWPGIAWAARIPLATAVLAIALYTPAA